jgi:hypothetical protein
VDEWWKRGALDSLSLFDDDLPNVDRLVAEIMARDSHEAGYAAAVVLGIVAKLATDARQ